ncbi:NAD(P)-dependent oxidoreductase [Acrocarpospora catenulata]|uniref:NAD(P)-dependent oxidoreductase n=1 Tax=Acrocarpospora catenulata TaxID=2836182 RepID=UPI001BD9895E|nr:NAD(P)-dependent oxidoreductase [Acrocarpospora catenulata]
MTAARVGWIGLGDQGVPLVRRLLTAPHDVVLWARREQSLEPFSGTRALVAASPAELGERCDVIAVCVTADSDVVDVAVGGGLLAAMRPGTTLVVHSTVAPRTCVALAEQAAPLGVDVIDAPVTRDGASHEESRFSLLVGGETDVVARVHPVLRAYADFVFHLGPLGSGQHMKIINNTLAVSNLALIFDALRVGEAAGLDPEEMLAALRHTSGGSVMVGLTPFYRPEPRMDYVNLLDKDVGLFTALVSGQTGQPPSLLNEIAREMVDRLLAAGGTGRTGKPE